MIKQEETLDGRRLLKYDLVILAGGGGTVSLPGQGQRARALAELKSRRLLDYIMDAVKQSKRIASVVLVLAAAAVTVHIVLKKLLSATPGDLIYDR